MIITIASTLIAWSFLMLLVGNRSTTFDVYFNRTMVLVLFGSIATLIYQFVT